MSRRPILQTIVFDKSQSLCIFAVKGSFCHRKCDYFWTKVAEFPTKVGTFLKKLPLFFHPSPLPAMPYPLILLSHSI